MPAQVPGFLIQSFPSLRGVTHFTAPGLHVSIMDATYWPFSLRVTDINVFHSLYREPLQAWVASPSAWVSDFRVVRLLRGG